LEITACSCLPTRSAFRALSETTAVVVIPGSDVADVVTDVNVPVGAVPAGVAVNATVEPTTKWWPVIVSMFDVAVRAAVALITTGVAWRLIMPVTTATLDGSELVVTSTESVAFTRSALSADNVSSRAVAVAVPVTEAVGAVPLDAVMAMTLDPAVVEKPLPMMVNLEDASESATEPAVTIGFARAETRTTLVCSTQSRFP
jgi:hypothetical protein